MGGHKSLARRPPNGPIVHRYSFECVSQIFPAAVGIHQRQVNVQDYFYIWETNSNEFSHVALFASPCYVVNPALIF
ncbi:hypothetical protein NQ317_013733 [Molorchus minor]|uniref:Uncharacterized protein n=1 Tax=Molorchus minor TaxID=1323400 RepID=A0ABQ9JNZ9_9CUCU|nr:hypothetical protein NQ317_013733 [Molorchus minor]